MPNEPIIHDSIRAAEYALEDASAEVRQLCESAGKVADQVYILAGAMKVFRSRLGPTGLATWGSLLGEVRDLIDYAAASEFVREPDRRALKMAQTRIAEEQANWESATSRTTADTATPETATATTSTVCCCGSPLDGSQDHTSCGAPIAQGWTGRKCTHCNGTGEQDRDPPHHRCGHCGGTGDEYGPLAPPATAEAAPLEVQP